MDEISENYMKKTRELKLDARKGVNIKNKVENARFEFNKERFRALMRLAGRSSFLPFPPVAVAVGGRDPSLNYVSIQVDSNQIEDTTRSIDEALSESLELEEKSVQEISSKDLKEEEEDDSTS